MLHRGGGGDKEPTGKKTSRYYEWERGGHGGGTKAERRLAGTSLEEGVNSLNKPLRE